MLMRGIEGLVFSVCGGACGVGHDGCFALNADRSRCNCMALVCCIEVFSRPRCSADLPRESTLVSTPMKKYLAFAGGAKALRSGHGGSTKASQMLHDAVVAHRHHGCFAEPFQIQSAPAATVAPSWAFS